MRNGHTLGGELETAGLAKLDPTPKVANSLVNRSTRFQDFNSTKLDYHTTDSSFES
jgi:hypothetical protein